MNGIVHAGFFLTGHSGFFEKCFSRSALSVSGSCF